MFLRRLLSHSSIDYTNKLTNEFYSLINTLTRTKRRLKNSSKSSTKTAPQAAITFSSNRIRPLWSDAVKAQKEKTRKETANIVRRRCYRRPWNKTKMERRNRTRKKDERRNKGDARKDLRSSRYVRFCLFFLCIFISRHRDLLFLALLPPGPAIYQVFSGFLKMRIAKRTKSWAVVSPCPWRYFNQEVDISFPLLRFHSMRSSHLRTHILTSVLIYNNHVTINQYRNSRTNSAKTRKKFKTAKRTTATRLSRENTHAWKLARELRKICLREFR